MADVKITVGTEVDKDSLRTTEQELSKSVLGSQGSTTGKKSGIEAYTDSMERLAGLMTEIMKVMGDGTKQVAAQVALREKELALIKEGQKAGGGAKPEAAPGVNEQEEKERRSRFFRKAVQNVGSGVSTVGNWAMQGGSAQSSMQMGATFANMLAPEIAPIINAVSGVMIQALDKDDRTKEAALRGYQVEGARGANFLLDGDDMNNRMRKALGFNAERYSALQVSLAKRQGDSEGINDIMRGENEFGLGSEMAGLQTTGRRMGTKASSSELFGASFALAVGEGLGRGRLGEVMNQLQGAIAANTRASTDVQATTERFAFISTLGAQYKGDTAASREADAAIKGLGQGNTAYTQYSMLKAAGLGSGASYSEAWLKSQKGVDTEGGISSKDLILANFSSEIPRYARGNAAQKAAIVQSISMRTGMNGALVEQILNSLVSSGETFGVVDVKAGQAGFDKNIGNNAKEPILDLHRQQVNGESASGIIARVGRWLGGEGGMGAMDASGNVNQRAQATGMTMTPSGPATTGGTPSPPVIRGSKLTSSQQTILKAYGDQYGIPVEYLNSWVNEEFDPSHPTTKYNERGFFQIMGGYDKAHPFKGSQADGLGMTESQHTMMTMDSNSAMAWGVKSVAAYHKAAQQEAGQYGLNWNETDMWRLTKLNHGGSGAARHMLGMASQQLGHAPKDFQEMVDAVKALASKQEQAILNNAMKMEIHLYDHRKPQITVTPIKTGAPGTASTVKK